MGMFDYVDYEMNCPTCGTKITEFQSKDKYCVLEHLQFWEVDKFYTMCSQCQSWIEYRIKIRRPPVPITYYEMKVETKEEREKKNNV